MVNLFITGSQGRYDASTHPDKLLYLDGFIGACSFIDKNAIDNFNSTIVGMDNTANGMMLEKLDADIEKIMALHTDFNANKFIKHLPAKGKLYSTLINLHKNFVSKKYLLQLVLDKFFGHFSLPAVPLILLLPEDHYLTQQLPYKIESADYYSIYKNAYRQYLLRQLYYTGYKLLSKKKPLFKTQIAIFLLDIPNEFELVKRFIALAQAQNIKLAVVLIDSGNPADKRVDTGAYRDKGIDISYLHEYKAPLYTNYDSFYTVCEKIDPLYSVYRKARTCEEQDIYYGFMDAAVKRLSPQVCLYLNTQEQGRVMANVCAAYSIPSVAVDYSFFFDTYNIEKRIRFDVRACISAISSFNWRKHKDPTAQHVETGFCKIDDWQEKLEAKKTTGKKLFDNNNRTILFASTWAPNPDSPLLTEKVKIVEQLSEMCYRNGWNLIIKKHPSEFDSLVNNVFDKNKYACQKLFEHAEMPLFDCTYYSDFICTQNSTAFIEALYLNKPFSYISTTEDNTWAGLSYFSKEKEVGTFAGVAAYEQYVQAHAGEAAYRQLQYDFMKLQTDYLYKTDGKASERLLQLATSYLQIT